MKKIIFSLTTILTILFIGLQQVQSQKTTYQKLKKLYQKQDFEACYQEAQGNGSQGKLFQGLALWQLPKDHKLKKNLDKPMLQALQRIGKAKGNLPLKVQKDTAFLLPEIKNFQESLFNLAGPLYRKGRKEQAETYFNTMYHTFDNTSMLFKNFYGFDGAHFLSTLHTNILKEKKINQEYYSRKIEKRIDKYYRNNEAFKQWDNPKYRLANTAASEDYLKKEEKNIYSYLNLARMNPELFRRTFLDARLRVRYHGEIIIKIPIYDTLAVSNYSQTLSQKAFFDLPVHKIYIDEIPQKEIKQYIQKKLIAETQRGKKYQYDIKYSGLYNHLKENHPKLLKLKNLKKFELSEQGKGEIHFKLYDKKFTYYRRTYTEETKGNHYYQSLFKKLNNMKPQNLIYPDKQLFKTAECWAIEAGKRGLKGHDRINCQADYHSEACDYGNKNGLDVVLNLLIDKFVPSLGHRKTLLGDYSEMGAAIRPHNSGLNYNAVLDFKR